VNVSKDDLDFLIGKPGAAMITVGRDGMPKVARVGVAWVDGQLWSSGTAARTRTRRLRRDPRCTLYVPDAAFSWVALETTVTILEGPDVPQLHVKMMREMQGKPSGPLSWFGEDLEEEEFLRTMVEEGRLIYQFEIHGTYGMH
jgi:Pyridoxamine 5'-phosphate oxidase